jgi:multiple antibiotic resistance protein
MLENQSLTNLVQAILILFIIMDPIGNAPLFYSYTEHLSPALRRKIISTSVAIAAGILIFFGVLGQPFFSYFGVTLPDFKIAGGIILFLYGVMGILGKSEATNIEEPESLAVVPFATPLLAGPGAIATIVYTHYNWGLETTIISIVVNTLVSLALLLAGERLLRILGRQGSLILVRIFAMILTGIAVAMIRDGIIGIVKMGL